MYDQAKVKPLARSAFFEDGAGARLLLANTIFCGFLRIDCAYWTGIGADGQPVNALPVPVNHELLLHGQKVFNVYCSPCHDRTGSGNGMIVRRGFKPPPSFHLERLRQAPLGYFVSVMTEGFGQMPSYAGQVPIADRWAAAAYVRALQRSHQVSLSQLTDEERSRLEAPAAPPGDGAASEGPAAASPPPHPETPIRR